jgi:murein L,D-transpeptidase YafK
VSAWRVLQVLWLSSAGCAADAPLPAPAAPAPPPAAPPPAPGTCAATAAGIPGVDPADPRLAGHAVIVVEKSARRLGLYDSGAVVGCWPVGLGQADGADGGPKLRRGDLRTPEGWYRTSDRPWSSFYHAVTIHYPNAADADRGVATGRITAATRDRIVAAVAAGRTPPQDTPLGGDLLFHGGGSTSDWTLGCIALQDADIDALRSHLPAGMKTDTLILP